MTEKTETSEKTAESETFFAPETLEDLEPGADGTDDVRGGVMCGKSGDTK